MYSTSFELRSSDPDAFDPVADIFEPPSTDPGSEIVLTIETAGPRHWLLHRSDGRCGGIFVDRKSALHEARQEASMLSDALIVIAEAGEDIIKERFRAGRPATESRDFALDNHPRRLARAA